MRNDYGTRPYISRFSGKTAKSSPKKQTANDKLDESLGEEMVKSLLSLSLLKIEETNQEENSNE